MKKELYDTLYQDLMNRLDKLPDHNSEQIRIAKEQLEALEFSFNLGKINFNLISATKDSLYQKIRKIDAMSFEDLADSRNLEDPYKGGEKDDWANYSRFSRMDLLVKNFEFLSRLRNDEPEAWDEVNELFFDD